MAWKEETKQKPSGRRLWIHLTLKENLKRASKISLRFTDG
jgi:hypothetical protein